MEQNTPVISAIKFSENSDVYSFNAVTLGGKTEKDLEVSADNLTQEGILVLNCGTSETILENVTEEVINEEP